MADCQHSHSRGRTKGRANNSVLCELTQQVTQQSTLSAEQLQGRITQWLLSQGEHSSPTYFTPQLKNRSGSISSHTGGADSVLDRAVEAREHRGGLSEDPLEALAVTPPVTPPVVGIVASTL